MNEFRYTSYPQEVIFGAGSLAKLSELVAPYRRLMLCSSGSLRREGTISVIEKQLAGRLVVVYERVEPHVQDFQVAEALELAVQQEIDAVIGLGAGSPLGLAKAISLGLAERRAARPSHAPGIGADTVDQPFVPIIAIPTTYAGSEITPVYGVTQHKDGIARKVTITNPKIVPALVIYDPLLTLRLPQALAASTGINALAHCIEALYSITRNPPSTAVALSGIRAIMRALPRCYTHGDDIEARTEMLQGAFLAGTALAHVSMAVHHGVCHVLGGTAGVPHGIANSIMLPHAMRFNLAVAAPQLAEAAEAMSISRAGRSDEVVAGEAIARVHDLIAGLNLPQHLRDVGVQEADLPQLAQLALQSRAVQNNPRPVTNAAEIEELLRAAW